MRLFMFCTLLFSSLSVYGQLAWPNPSPPRQVTQEVGQHQVSIHYDRPAARGRLIFGGLVPYGKLWRTGAAYCTKLSFSQPVWIDGQEVAAGTYSLFTIPQPKEWTIILNSDTSLYGTPGYEAAKDVIRFTVTPDSCHRFYEGLTLDLDLVPDDLVFHFNWANTHWSFPIKTGTDAWIMSYIDGPLKELKQDRHQELAMAAFYLQITNQRIPQAIELAAEANENHTQPWAGIIEAELLAKTGKVELARQRIKALIAYRQAHPFDSEKETEWDLQYLREKLKEVSGED